MGIPGTRSRLMWWFGGATLAVYGGLFLYLAAHHVLYPGFTESMEGDALQHVERIVRGEPSYPAPGGEFIAITYMPLYYYLAAPLYLLLGDSLAGPRLVSVLCTLAAGVMVGWIAWREARSGPVA